MNAQPASRSCVGIRRRRDPPVIRQVEGEWPRGRPTAAAAVQQASDPAKDQPDQHQERRHVPERSEGELHDGEQGRGDRHREHKTALHRGAAFAAMPDVLRLAAIDRPICCDMEQPGADQPRNCQQDHGDENARRRQPGDMSRVIACEQAEGQPEREHGGIAVDSDAAPFEQDLAQAAVAGTGLQSLRGGYRIDHSTTPNPATMNASARLKTGQSRRSMKSVTVPRRSRSIRLPVAPPSAAPSPTHAVHDWNGGA